MRRASRSPSSSTALAAAAIAATLVAPGPALADQLTGDALERFISDRRVYLQTPFGGEFPLNYQSSGRVTGDGTALGLGRYFAPKETGQWYVDGQWLCQQFPTWYRGKTSCFTIRKTSETTLIWRRDDGESGRARIEG